MTDAEKLPYHVPVLLKESVDGLNIHEGGIYVDVTFGGGGHSREILSRLNGTGHLYSFDQDADAAKRVFGGSALGDSNGEPDTAFLKARLSEMLDEHRDAEIYITQGYICKNAYGETDNLQRGGSDYSASLIGAAVGAEEIEIWTDIDGMHNNDPRYVENTRPVERLNFEEAAELAYFGAKILHPTCVQPAKLNNIPVRLLSTLDPSAKGTLIDNMAADHTIKAVAAKDGITAIRVKSSRMLLAYGFMSKVFEIFEAHKTPIDMVTVSEVGVSVTVDNERNLESIIAELRKFGTVTIDHDMVIICVVGDLEWQNRGFEAKALAALKDIPVRMISYGGSNCNISFLIRKEDKEDKVAALAKLSEELFNRQ